MLIVSDTSPITNLIQIEQLDVLQQIFKKIVIPNQVYIELVNYEHQKEEIDKRDWILVKSVKNPNEVKILEQQLDAGEAEAIILAKELKADFLIIDERKGRKIAKEHGFKIVGLLGILGILIQGKREGHINTLKPLLDKLIDEIGFRVSKKLYTRILTEVNE